MGELELQAVLDALEPMLVMAAVRSDDGTIRDFRVVAANAGAADLLGLDPSELARRTWFTSSISRESPATFDELVAVVEAGTPLSITAPGLRQDLGRTVDVRAERLGDGFLVRALDITEQTRARRQFHAGVLAQPDPVVLLEPRRDADGRVVDLVYAAANDAARPYAGTDDLVGHSMAELRPDTVERGQLDRLIALAEAGTGVLREISSGDERTGTSPEVTYETLAFPVGDLLAVTWRSNEERVAARKELLAERERFRALADTAADFVIETDTEWTITWVSQSASDYAGWAPGEPIGHSIAEYTHPDDADTFRSFVATLERDSIARTVMRLVTAAGDYRWLQVTARARHAPDGTVVGYIGSGADFEETMAFQRALTESEARFRLIAEHASDIVLRADAGAVIEWISPSIEQVLGWPPEDVVGRGLAEMLHPDDVHVVMEVNDRLARGEVVAPVVRWRAADGTHRWMGVRAEPVTDDDGRFAGRVAGLRDIEEIVLAQQALAASEERFRSAMRSAPTGMALVDLDRRFVAVNPALCAMAGRDEAWMLGHRVPDVLDSDDPEEDAADLAMRSRVLSGRTEDASTEKRLISGSGERVWVQHSLAPLHGHDGIATGYVEQFVDITEAVEARSELAYRATHDPLTDTRNRSDLYRSIDELRRRTLRAGDRMGVLFVDVDRLKEVNDTYGHAAGDDVLVAVAERIRSQVRADDVVARFGGDEFVVVLPSLRREDDALQIAGKLHESMRRPIGADGNELVVTVSIGVAVAVSDRTGPDGDPEAAEALLHRADVALLAAKRAGRDTVVLAPPTETP